MLPNGMFGVNALYVYKLIVNEVISSFHNFPADVALICPFLNVAPHSLKMAF